MSPKRALVLGSGVAGLTSAHLLAARGWRVDCAMSSPTPGPVVIISRSNADLLRELWHADETLFAGAHRLRGRVVQWEGAADPMHTTTPALVMSVGVLQERLVDRAGEKGLCFVARERVDPARYDWAIQAGGREATSGKSITFGCRRGVAVSVKLTSRAHTDRAARSRPSSPISPSIRTRSFARYWRNRRSPRPSSRKSSANRLASPRCRVLRWCPACPARSPWETQPWRSIR